NGATTFNNLSVPGSYTVANCDIHISGNATILGSYAAGSGVNTIDGDLLNAGTMSSTGTTTFTGTRLQTIQLLTAIQSISSGIVNFNGTFSPVLNSTTPPLFANVNINNTAGVTASVGWTVVGGFTVASGAAFNGSGFTHVFYGTVANSGSMTSGGMFDFSPATDTTLALGSVSSSGIVAFSGANHITISSGALSLGSIRIANTHAAGITPVSNWTLAGDLDIDSGATFHAGSGLTHKIAGDFNNQGTLDGGTSTFEFNGTSTLAGAGSTVFNNVLVSGSLADSSPISVTGNFVNNGSFAASGADVRFTGSSASAISGSTTPTTIDSLVIAKTSATVTLAVIVNGVSSLTISGGTLDTGSYSLSQNATDGGTLSIGASGTLKLGGDSPFPTFSNGVTLDPACTVNYAGTAQTVAAISYANLVLSGSGNKTLSSTNTINGNVEISGTAKFNLTYASASYSPVGSLTFGGAVQAAGTWGSSSSSAGNKTDTYFQGTGKLNVGNRNLDHFAVTVTSDPQTAGTPFNITTITAQDANNNTVGTFTGTVDLTETGDGAGGTVSPSQSIAFTAGVLSGQSVTLTKAGAAVTITVADHAGTGKSGVSDPFTVNAGALNRYAVTFSTPPYQVGVPFTTIVTAQDANNNTVTADSSTVVVVSSSTGHVEWQAPGSSEFDNGLTAGQEDHVTRTLTNGVALFNSRDLVTETCTVTATSSGPTITGTSASIQIESQAGSYRSKTSGNWGSASTWEAYDGSAWVNAVAPPTYSAGVILIQSGHIVTVAADIPAETPVDQVHILSGGRVNVSTGVTLTIGAATSPGLEVHGTLANAGTLACTVGSYSFVWGGGVLQNSGTVNSTIATLEFEPGSPGGKYQHLFTTTAGTIPTAEWEGGSICEIVGYTDNTGTPDGLNQSFYDFTWNCPNQGGGVSLGSSFTTVAHNFTVTSTGSGSLTLGHDLAVTGTATVSSDGELNCGTYKITGAAFTLSSGGTLGIGSADGISSSGNSGNIQTTTRTFATDGDYLYNGTAAQTTGSGLPANVHNLTIQNSAGVTLTAAETVSGTVALGSTGKL
ncbi:MAG: hypothetical protein NT154_39545, partial [Verrucomicrobia bacterium]|nr:hypothetical protein [Verrucomicrobiota bacterium]